MNYYFKIQLYSHPKPNNPYILNPKYRLLLVVLLTLLAFCGQVIF